MAWSSRRRCVFVWTFVFIIVSVFTILSNSDHSSKSDDGKQVELVSPPADAPVGERVFIDGLSGEPLSSAQVKKKKVWESVAKGLKTGEKGVATWDGKDIVTSVGACSAFSLVGAQIS